MWWQILQPCILTQFVDHLCQYMLTNSVETSKKMFICCIFYIKELNRHVRLVCRPKISCFWFIKKIIFQFKWWSVVVQPLQPAPRMAHECYWFNVVEVLFWGKACQLYSCFFQLWRKSADHKGPNIYWCCYGWIWCCAFNPPPPLVAPASLKPRTRLLEPLNWLPT